jgi:hypothetical protein
MAMLELWGDLLVAAWQAAPAPRNLLTKSDGTKEIVVEGLQVGVMCASRGGRL